MIHSFPQELQSTSALPLCFNMLALWTYRISRQQYRDLPTENCFQAQESRIMQGREVCILADNFLLVAYQSVLEYSPSASLLISLYRTDTYNLVLLFLRRYRKRNYWTSSLGDSWIHVQTTFMVRCVFHDCLTSFLVLNTIEWFRSSIILSSGY